MKLHGFSHYLVDVSDSAALLWSSSRLLCNVHWRWDAGASCYVTHRWSRDTRAVDVKEWPAENALSSLLRAVREDERLQHPAIRWIALSIAMEYVQALVEARQL